jgi:hypothetical protein
VLILHTVSLCAEDDTFQYLRSTEGTLVTLEKGDWGYKGYSQTVSVDTKFDARGCTFHSRTWPEIRGKYAIKMGSTGKDVVCYWGGGLIVSDNDPNISWYQDYNVRYGNNPNGNNCGYTATTGRNIFDGVRIWKLHDGFKPANTHYDTCGGFVVKNCWFSYIRDDCIENDWFNPGVIEDCLMDGVFAFYSSRNKNKFGTPPGYVVKIRDCLVRLEPMLWDERDPDRYIFGQVFKDGHRDNPAIELVNCIFLIEKCTRKIDILPRNLKFSRDNIVIWMGERGRTCEGFTAYGPEGKPIWDEARLKWIKNHPLVARLPGDPKPVFSDQGD